MTVTRVYLDYNATVPILPAVGEAVAEALRLDGNPSSVHAEGRAARARVEDARAAVATSLGAAAAAVVFTASGSEANALALRGTDRARILVAAVEHASVRQGARDITTIPCDGDGIVRLDALERLLAADERPALVSVMAANNETGVIQPLADVVRLARAHGALVHTDAVQAYGRLALDFAGLGVDLMSVSAHKIGGPKGAGALVVRAPLELAALVRGGGQERGRRAGTEALPAIVGFGVAAGHVPRLVDDAPRLERWRDAFEAALSGARVIGAGVRRLPNTSAIVMPGVAAATQVMAFDLDGFAVSAGAACSSGKVGPSHVLAAMGLDRAQAGSAIRVSSGWRTTEPELDDFAAAWCALRARLGGARAAA
ncbi:MAG: cysteine desulfurase family protein [Alphaproteobacteria bacterium]